MQLPDGYILTSEKREMDLFEIVPQSVIPSPIKKVEIDMRSCDWNHLGI